MGVETAAELQTRKDFLVLLKDRVLFVPGVWNGITFTEQALRDFLPFVQESPPYQEFIQRNSLFLDHKDDGESWVGLVPHDSVRWKEGVGPQGEGGIVGDVGIVDAATAAKVDFQQSRGDTKFGISPRIGIIIDERDGQKIAQDIIPKSWAAVVEPAQGENTMLSLENGIVCGPIVSDITDVRLKKEQPMDEKQASAMLEALSDLNKGVKAQSESFTALSDQLSGKKVPKNAGEQIEELCKSQSALQDSITKLTEQLSADKDDKSKASKGNRDEVIDLISKLMPFGVVPKLNRDMLSEADQAAYDAVVEQTDKQLLNAVAFAAQKAEELGVEVLAGEQFRVSFRDVFFSKDDDDNKKKQQTDGKSVNKDAKLSKADIDQLAKDAVDKALAEEEDDQDGKPEYLTREEANKVIEQRVQEALKQARDKRKSKTGESIGSTERQSDAELSKQKGGVRHLIDDEKFNSSTPENKLKLLSLAAKGLLPDEYKAKATV